MLEHCHVPFLFSLPSSVTRGLNYSSFTYFLPLNICSRGFLCRNAFSCLNQTLNPNTTTSLSSPFFLEPKVMSCSLYSCGLYLPLLPPYFCLLLYLYEYLVFHTYQPEVPCSYDHVLATFSPCSHTWRPSWTAGAVCTSGTMCKVVFSVALQVPGMTWVTEAGRDSHLQRVTSICLRAEVGRQKRS